jgi:hypothetical protein
VGECVSVRTCLMTKNLNPQQCQAKRAHITDFSSNSRLI